MPPFSSRFAFLRWPLAPLRNEVVRSPEDPLLETHLAKSRYSVRLLRYWWAAQAIREEAARLKRPLVIVDYGSGRGWLKRFVGEGVDAQWIAVDWQPQSALLKKAGYDQIHEANFDAPLPLAAGQADVVAALHVFEHLPRPSYSLHHVAESLAPGGCLLAGSPTSPSFVARWRQAYFRRKLARGTLARGGHINSLSPDRWRTLLEDSGFGVEWAAGSHLMRHTGNPLENSSAWIRLNQLWGALFPSLGSEICLRARKPAAVDSSAAAWSPQLLRHRRHPARLAMAGAGVAGLCALATLPFLREARLDAKVAAILNAHLNDDAEHLLLIAHHVLDDFKSHPNATVIKDVDTIPQKLAQLPSSTHIVLHEKHLESLVNDAGSYMVDARIDAGLHDFYLLRQCDRGDGTPLEHFLSRHSPKAKIAVR
jgi:SAM-dependent methyltransferase